MSKKMTRKDFLKTSAASLAGLTLTGNRALGGPLGGMQSPGNPIVIENAKPGTAEWRLDNLSRNREIEGYASATSVARGGEISFFVNTAERNYTIEIFRLGWYGGLGGRRMTNPVTRRGRRQTIPTPNPTTGLIQCNWRNEYEIDIPRSSDPTVWASGLYVAKLTASVSGKQSYIIFVVRDDNRASTHLFQSSVTTFQAYNAWGGKSLYDFNSTGGRAYKVSFDRPYDDGFGTGQVYADWAGWELNMLRFLEREGYDLTYCTDLDTHENPNLLLSHKSFLSVGHDEYWSWQMRRNVENARNRRVSLGFFTANACYWQVRFESQNNRTMVCYKDSAKDPYYGSPSTNPFTTVTWRDPILNRPENALLGVMYDYYPVNGDIVVENTNHWAFQNTGLADGSRLYGLLGYEADRIFPGGPANLVRLAHSPLVVNGQTGYSDMSVYTHASGATVFATGSIQWAWGLDDFFAGYTHPNLVSQAAQQITRNVLARFAL